MRVVVFTLMVGLGLGLGQSYRPPCSEALVFSANAFSELFVAVNNDSSEQGYDQAAVFWANCKRQDNLRRLDQSPALRSRLEQLRRLYIELRSAETKLALEFYGGGTLYSHSLTRSVATIEEHLSDLIHLSTFRVGASQARGFGVSQDYNLNQLEITLRALRTRTDRQIGLANRARWDALVGKYEQTFRSILKLTGNRRDATSATILNYVNTPLWIREILR